MQNNDQQEAVARHLWGQLDLQLGDIQHAYEKEMRVLEAKYQELRNPLYERRLHHVPRGLWRTVLLKHETTAQMIFEQDHDCLQYLVNITCGDDEWCCDSFTIYFWFASTNPYFSNGMLAKHFKFDNLYGPNDPEIQSIVGVEPIEWTTNNNITVKKTRKRQRGKGTHVSRVRVEEPSAFAGHFRNYNTLVHAVVSFSRPYHMGRCVGFRPHSGSQR